jgi:ferredoxin
MSLSVLKYVRVALSLLFLLATSLVLLNFRNVIPAGVSRIVLFLQFTPSLLQFATATSFAAAGFGIVLLLTIVFGRVYCSTICPLGVLQDFFSFASRKLRKKRFHEPLEPYTAIHTAFLVVAALPVVIGSVFAVILLDPFSNFGRMVSSLLRPAMMAANNLLANVFEAFGSYAIYRMEIKDVAALAIVFPVLFLLFVAWMSFQHGRLYCNSMCPVGSLLRIVSKYSLFKIAINPDNCRSCQLCQQVCKAGCIDRKAKSVDFSRCVGCYNCLTVCPSHGLHFVTPFDAKPSLVPITDTSRRSFLLGTTFFFVGQPRSVDTAKVVKPQRDSTIPERKHHPVAPPGAQSIRHFTQTCTGCHVCVGSCPSQVLQPSTLEYGLGGFLQPRMDYNASYCNFECTVCTDVCPSGALQKLSVEKKKTTQTGRVVFIRENCVVFTENTDCGACTEHCPTKAVTMVPFKNSRLPEIQPEYCIGCGACEHACPTRPYRAIYVEGNPIHATAKVKAPEKKREVDLNADFPF